ncbi:MAG: flagellar basal body rod protein FlgB [Lachnospiraceae bacterium]|nr:flagellar basal body rod protein FlgB [Lachnospiraceae bacterium]
MIQTSVFDYINVLDKAADASWLRNEAIANNLSNMNTPGYKRQDVSFEGQLAKALGSSRYETMDAKVAGVRTSSLAPTTYTDYSGYSYRIDGNNVDPDSENVALANNQIKYRALVAAYNQEFANLKAVMK